MKRIVAFLAAAVMCVCVLAIPAYADATNVVTIGQDLSDDQEAFIIKYFGADLSRCQVIYVNNWQEREYLGSWIPLEQIGNITISSAYVQPTKSGGIQVKTANLTYVTGNMIASVLSTAGITNCNVVAAAPFPVSGTGALTGVMIAYQVATGETLNESKRDLAIQEFTVTQQAAQSIGENEALQLVNAVKMQVIQSDVSANDTAQIAQIVDQVVTEVEQAMRVESENIQDSSFINDNSTYYDNSTNYDYSYNDNGYYDNSVTNVSGPTYNYGLSDQDRQLIIDLATRIAEQDYQYDEMKETLQRVEDNLSNETNINITIDNADEVKVDNNTEVNVSSENQNNSSADNQNTVTSDNQNISENNITASPEVSVEDDSESILSNTNDDLIDAALQSSTREEDIAAIEEAVIQEEKGPEPVQPEAVPAQPEAAPAQPGENEWIMDEIVYDPIITEPENPAQPEQPVYQDMPQIEPEPAAEQENIQPAQQPQVSVDEPWIMPEPDVYQDEPQITPEPEPYVAPEPVISTEPEPYVAPEPVISTEPEPYIAPEPEGGQENIQPQVSADEPWIMPEPDVYQDEPQIIPEPEPYVAPEPAVNQENIQPADQPQMNVEEPWIMPEPEIVNTEPEVIQEPEPWAEPSDQIQPEPEAFDQPAPAGMLGGWTVYTDSESENELPADVKDAFEKALSQYVGMNLKPVAFLASQMVAGTNYQILCTGAPVVPDAQEGLYVATVYADLEGNARITNVADFDLAKTEQTAEGGPDTQMLLGGWNTPAEIEEGKLPLDAQTAFDAAMEGMLGVEYTPAALLGTKVIAGTEYALLCHARTVTAEPENYYAVVFIAANADGTYSIMNIVPLEPADYNQ